MAELNTEVVVKVADFPDVVRRIWTETARLVESAAEGRSSEVRGFADEVAEIIRGAALDLDGGEEGGD